MNESDIRDAVAKGIRKAHRDETAKRQAENIGARMGCGWLIKVWAIAAIIIAVLYTVFGPDNGDGLDKFLAGLGIGVIAGFFVTGLIIKVMGFFGFGD